MKYGETINTWATELDGKHHSFRFEHQFWTGRKSYYIDEELVRHVNGGLFESGTRSDKTEFCLGEHNGIFEYSAKTEGAYNPGSVLAKDNGIQQTCKLTIDGKLITMDTHSTNIDDQQASRYPNWVEPVVIIMIIAFVVITIFGQ